MIRKEIVMAYKDNKGLIGGICEEELLDLADLFKMFSDSTRIKILYSLFDGEKNVSEICENIDMNQSAVSHQLKLLKSSKLVKSRREGKTVIYSLADDHVETIIAMGKDHIEE
ncbi:MAG: helix-turn-helix transcriptional regulator [Mogibacterium sp.]|nr:helix-turn-helix transcriptional regulator [Mogibacterium sp.]